ncbi:hypothetical protein [Yoonia sp. SDW83-1]|uniref:hypothetical protein n=1 Tax=Yoonia sp. SDW83-1 TaxID=3366945 RepID=UPI00398C5FA6
MSEGGFTLKLVAGGSITTAALCLLEYIKMRSLDIPLSVGLIGFDVIASGISHIGTLIYLSVLAGLIIIIAMMVARTVAWLFFNKLPIHAAGWYATAYLGYGAAWSLARGKTAWAGMSGSGESDARTDLAVLHEKADEEARLVLEDRIASIEARIDALRKKYEKQSKRFVRAFQVTKAAGPGWPKALRLLVVMAFLGIALSNAVAWNHIKNKRMWAEDGSAVHSKPLPEPVQLNVTILEWSLDCDSHRQLPVIAVVQNRICEIWISLANDYPLIHVTAVARERTAMGYLEPLATDSDLYAPFISKPYYYLGDFGPWAYLADADDPSRRVLIKRSHINEISRSAPMEIAIQYPDAPAVSWSEAAAKLQTWFGSAAAHIPDVNVLVSQAQKHEHQYTNDYAFVRDLHHRQWTVNFNVSMPENGSSTEPQVDTLTDAVLEILGPTQRQAAREVAKCMKRSDDAMAAVQFAENTTDQFVAGSLPFGDIRQLVASRHAQGDSTTLLLLGSASASGPPHANQIISERRAEMVGRLITSYFLDAGDLPDPEAAAQTLMKTHGLRLIAFGIGEFETKGEDTARRVQIIQC